MATFARRLLKTAVFIGLFILSIRYVRLFPSPWTMEQQKFLFFISDYMGVRDPENIYVPTMIFLELITTVILYRSIINIFRKINNKLTVNNHRNSFK